MRERVQMEQAPPARRRADLEEPCGQEQLTLALGAIAALPRDLLDLKQDLPMKTPWFPMNPVWTGWYEVRVPGFGPFPGSGHVERLWFDAEDGIWLAAPEDPAGDLIWPRSVDGAEWRGLAEPWPEGYRWRVPGARRFRAGLEGQ